MQRGVLFFRTLPIVARVTRVNYFLFTLNRN
jgi:hypothetical protein